MRPLAIAIAAAALVAGSAAAGEVDAHPSRFTVTDFEGFGVRVATAGPGVVDRGVELPGEVRPNAERTAHIAAQFPGRVREVRKSIGDTVRAGDVLAIVESDALAHFPLTTAISGSVIDRHVVAGEVVDRDSVAFVIADLSTVWVEIGVYQKDLPAVQPGARVHIAGGYGIADAEGVISYVSPVVEQATRTASARVELSNANGTWRPGMFVTARVLDPVPAAIVVNRAAVQRHDGQSVVFAVEGERFVARTVQLGRQGRTAVEILGGLASGERYASDGAFLVKAELTAGGDAHEH
ncbi:MAG: efflux RND transporter periplasmic adaptor subunit [Candidatus Binatia bacterium]